MLPLTISQIQQKIIRSDNSLSNPKTDYQIRENHGLKPLSDKGSSISQTLQTIQSHQTRGGQEKVFSSNQESNEQEIVHQTKRCKREQEINEEKKLVTENESVEQSTRHVVQKRTKIINPRIKLSDTSKSSADIPNDLREKLEGLEIPLDDQVRSAIASHDISQAYGAAAHVENTWDTINNPRSVFLYQLPKQPIEKLGSRYSEEIISNIKAQNQAIEKERSDPEYYEKSKNAFAQIRAKLKGKKAQ
jgi:hypothetical protein